MFFMSFYGIFLPYYDAKRIKSIPFSVLDIFTNHCRSPLPLPLHLKCPKLKPAKLFYIEVSRSVPCVELT